MERSRLVESGESGPAARERLLEVARVTMRDVLGLRPAEEVLIVTNPQSEVLAIAESLFQASQEMGGQPVLMVQPVKTMLDHAERSVLAALASEPAVFISISHIKLGKDPYGLHIGYVGRDGKKYHHISEKLREGDGRLRSFWSPSITLDMFLRCVDIDYATMRRQIDKLYRLLARAQEVRLTSPAGTDVTVRIGGRKPFKDDGDFSTAGLGGNLPAGETFISPVIGGTDGVVVFDGSISVGEDPDIMPTRPIRVTVRGGYVTAVEQDSPEAARLLRAIEDAEGRARQMGQTDLARNARHIGELGFGFNPKAQITGNLLEDEKVFDTCHLAIGSNYDHDAEALNHFDGLVRRPTVYVDGRKITYYDAPEER